MIKIIFLLFFCTFFNFNVFADVKDDISKINDLKETGLLSDQDYKNLLEKSIIETEEYKKIKSLFDSEVINLEEFENFKNKIITKYTLGDTLTEDSSAAKEAADKAAKEAADKAAKEAADKAAKEAAKEAADKAEVTREEIGKVLKTTKGKSFGDDKKLKRKQIVETGALYKTLAGGVLHLMLDEKTRIFIGYESEIIINKFDIIDPKVHEVEIELISGSFLYYSLRKTSTDLKVLIDDNILTSKGFETSVAFLKNEKEIRFVNAGRSSLTYEDKILSFAEYAILQPLSKSISINSIPQAKGDKLIGTALGDFSMTVMGEPAGVDTGSGEGTAPAATGGGCG
tara:strand:+ start:173 stop:1198 length:1026 start_codon:yes stop_codon:yes gene_type:complete